MEPVDFYTKNPVNFVASVTNALFSLPAITQEKNKVGVEKSDLATCCEYTFLMLKVSFE